MQETFVVEAPLALSVTRLVLVLSLFALVARSAAAQVRAQPGPADAAKPAPAVVYDSAFNGYRPFVDPDPARWREVNDEMGRLNGHAGHLPGSVSPRGAPGKPKPAADAGHAGTK